MSNKGIGASTSHVYTMTPAWARLIEPVHGLIYGDGGAVVVPRRHAPEPGRPAANPVPAEAGSKLLSRRDIAAWLSVSTRWVERHLRPSAQAAAGGRAWYARDDVEGQLAQLHGGALPASRRGAPVDGASPAQRRARRAAAAGESVFEGVEHAREVAALEASLRASVETPRGTKRRTRGSKR